jgi:hypothetical protein
MKMSEFNIPGPLLATPVNTPPAVTMLGEFYRAILSELEVKVELLLEAKLDHRLTNFTLAAENIQGIDEKIEKRVDYVIEDTRFYAENIEGLDNEVERAVKRAVRDYDFTIDTDAVDGLDDAIGEAVSEAISEADDRMNDTIAEKVDEAISDEGTKLMEAITAKLGDAVEKALSGPVLQAVIAKKVQEAMTQAVARLLGNLFTVQAAAEEQKDAGKLAS